jgi:hypothetical protein
VISISKHRNVILNAVLVPFHVHFNFRAIIFQGKFHSQNFFFRETSQKTDLSFIDYFCGKIMTNLNKKDETFPAGNGQISEENFLEIELGICMYREKQS